MNLPFHMLAALIPLVPLAAALGIAVRMARGHTGGDEHEPGTARLATGAAGFALLAVLALDALALLDRVPGMLAYGTWFASGDFAVRLGLLADARALPFATLVALVGWLTLRFSVDYMHREDGFHRFFLAMCLFLAGMQTVVLAGNLVLLFVGWELIGLSSYLLIGYARERAVATGNALRAFVTNRLGDAGLVAATGGAFAWIGTLDWDTLAQAVPREASLDVGFIAFALLVAALAKSAQVPFSPWIARALEGPTPSSAIFYGSLMVHAGVFLLIRAEPLLTAAPAVMALVAAAGLLTALYGGLSSRVQTDVKSALMFSTTAQVGLMFLACGLGWFDWALLHLLLHAALRSWQFLAAPSFMHDAPPQARPALPALLRGQRMYTAALNRFWLEPLGDWLISRPTQGLARDAHAFDAHVLSRIVGLPPDRHEAERDPVIRGHGLAGAMLLRVGARLADFERHLVLREGGAGPMRRALASLGAALVAFEGLLERPRYLLLLLMATVVVIL